MTAAHFSTAVEVEWLKLRRSRVVATASALVALGIPALTVGFLRAASTDKATPLAEKAHAMVSGGGWPAYLDLANQVLSVSGLLAVGVTVGWCYGREFSDGTIGSLYALPVSRGTTAAAKATVLALWSIALSVVTMALLIAAGPLAGLGAPDGSVPGATLRGLAVALLTAALGITMALPASVGRGYLPAVAALLLLVVAAQLAVAFGAGAWFPYAAVGLGGQQATAADVHAVQLLLVPLTAAAAVAATAGWWAHAQLD